MQGCSAAGCASGCCRDQKRSVAPFRRPKTFTQMEPAEKKQKREKRNTAFSNRGKQIPISKNINSKQETALIRVLLPQRTAQVRLIILTTIDNRNRAETSGCNSPHLNLQCDKNKLPIKSMSSACSMYKRSVETLWPKSTAEKKNAGKVPDSTAENMHDPNLHPSWNSSQGRKLESIYEGQWCGLYSGWREASWRIILGN